MVFISSFWASTTLKVCSGRFYMGRRPVHGWPFMGLHAQWLKWVGTRGNAVPPKAFSVPSKKNSVPAKAISVPAKKTLAFPPKDFAFPPRKCAELHGTPSTTPPRNWAGKLLQLSPPRIQRTSSTTPLLEIGPENSFNYPPFEFTELHRLPLSSPELVERTGTLPWKRSHCKKFPL